MDYKQFQTSKLFVIPFYSASDDSRTVMSAQISNSSSKSNRQLGMGCVALFALPFACTGIFMGYKSVESFLNREIKVGFLSLLAAALFGGAGFGLMIGAFFGSKSQKKLNARKAAHPDKPWLWREDWASGRIPSSNKAAMYLIWVFATVWNLISSGLAFGLAAEVNKGNRLALIALIFPLIGLGLLIFAIRTTIVWKKFGQSYFKIHNSPGTIGGQLDGVIETSTKIKPEDGLQLRCYCIHRDSTGENTSEHVLWEEEKIIIKDSLSDPRRSAFPVFFQIPDDCSPTDDSVSNHKIIWRLEARAKSDGIDYFAQFEVPVFKTHINRAATPAVDPTLAFQSPPKPYQQPANSKIKVAPAATGGTEFFFPARRNPGPLLFLFFFTTIWTGALWLMIHLKATIIFPIVFGIVEFFLLLGLASALMKSVRVNVNTSGIDIQNNWVLFKAPKQISTTEISDIKLKIGMTVGNTSYYDLQAHTTNNRTAYVGTGIKSKKEAEWLASEMLRHLKPGTTAKAPVSIQ